MPRRRGRYTLTKSTTFSILPNIMNSSDKTYCLTKTGRNTSSGTYKAKISLNSTISSLPDFAVITDKDNDYSSLSSSSDHSYQQQQVELKHEELRQQQQQEHQHQQQLEQQELKQQKLNTATRQEELQQQQLQQEELRQDVLQQDWLRQQQLQQELKHKELQQQQELRQQGLQQDELQQKLKRRLKQQEKAKKATNGYHCEIFQFFSRDFLKHHTIPQVHKYHRSRRQLRAASYESLFRDSLRFPFDKMKLCTGNGHKHFKQMNSSLIRIPDQVPEVLTVEETDGNEQLRGKSWHSKIQQVHKSKNGALKKKNNKN